MTARGRGDSAGERVRKFPEFVDFVSRLDARIAGRLARKSAMVRDECVGQSWMCFCRKYVVCI